MYIYRYTHNIPTLFINLQGEDGKSWYPNYGDTITVNRPLTHGFLELVSGPEEAPYLVDNGGYAGPASLEILATPLSDQVAEVQPETNDPTLDTSAVVDGNDTEGL